MLCVYSGGIRRLLAIRHIGGFFVFNAGFWALGGRTGRLRAVRHDDLLQQRGVGIQGGLRRRAAQAVTAAAAPAGALR